MTPVFLWSDWGSTSFLAHKLKRAGIPVTLYIHHEANRFQGHGYVPKTTDPLPPKGSLVIFDGIGHGDLGTTLRQKGHLVIGGNPFDTALERNRAEGISLMRKAGIKVPETKNFSGIAAAKTFLETTDGEWFLKVSGSHADEGSTCNADRETLLRYLDYVKTQPGEKSFILQQKVNGVEVSTNGWFDGVKFLSTFDGTIEEKKLLSGDLGTRTGCESNVVWLYRPAASLPHETVMKMESVLQESRYCGPLDLNAIITDDGTVYGLEWTARLGFDATQAWVRFFDPKSLVEQLADYAARFLTSWEVPKPTQQSFSLRISLPPYPEGSSKETAQVRYWPVDKAWISGEPYDPEDVMRSDSGPVCAGGSGLIGVIGMLGPSITPMRKDILEIADSLKMPSKQYRIDPLTRAEEDWKTLTKQGKV